MFINDTVFIYQVLDKMNRRIRPGENFHGRFVICFYSSLQIHNIEYNPIDTRSIQSQCLITFCLIYSFIKKTENNCRMFLECADSAFQKTYGAV